MKNRAGIDVFIKIVQMLSLFAIIVFASLGIFCDWQPASSITFPVVGISLLCNAYNLWGTERKLAYCSLAVAVCAFVTFVVFLFI